MDSPTKAEKRSHSSDHGRSNGIRKAPYKEFIHFKQMMWERSRPCFLFAYTWKDRSDDVLKRVKKWHKNKERERERERERGRERDILVNLGFISVRIKEYVWCVKKKREWESKILRERKIATKRIIDEREERKKGVGKEKDGKEIGKKVREIEREQDRRQRRKKEKNRGRRTERDSESERQWRERKRDTGCKR